MNTQTQKPLVSQFEHLNFSVKDVQQSVDWYYRVFDFELVESGIKNGIRWGIIQPQVALLCLYEYPDCQIPQAMKSKWSIGPKVNLTLMSLSRHQTRQAQ